ncbi:MAG: VOC family protein [Marinicella sp.]|nr:VOC family protein [Xanthomonadales bacterium]
MTQFKQRITPFLWFDQKAGEAAAFYTQLFPNSRVVEVKKYSETVKIYQIELFGEAFTLMEASSHHAFNEAISLAVECEDQSTIDHYWSELTSLGGKASMCGWLKDRYGVSWQIVPTCLNQFLADQDKTKANRVMQAMLGMQKLDITALEYAYNDK